jgi:hypothetical protein
MSELLYHSHPDEYLLWNRRAYAGLHYLGIDGLPHLAYQVTGGKYRASARIVVIAKQHVLSVLRHRVGKVERYPPAARQHARRSGPHKRLCKQQRNLPPLRGKRSASNSLRRGPRRCCPLPSSGSRPPSFFRDLSVGAQ